MTPTHCYSRYFLRVAIPARLTYDSGMLRALFWLMLCSVLLGTNPTAADSLAHVEWAHVSPTALYTSEEKTLLFTAAVTIPPELPNATITVLQLNPEQTGIKYRWELVDDGTYGDVQAHDGIYSRKMEFKEYRPTTLQFVVALEMNQPPRRPRIDPLPENLRTEQHVAVTVTPQPTFVEILRQIWHRLTRTKEQSAS